MMFGLGTQELVVIFLIVLVLFGSTKLPELGKGLGEAIRNFKKAASETDEINVTPDKKIAGDETKKEKGA